VSLSCVFDVLGLNFRWCCGGEGTGRNGRGWMFNARHPSRICRCCRCQVMGVVVLLTVGGEYVNCGGALFDPMPGVPLRLNL
jgi:hypothetical protein